MAETELTTLHQKLIALLNELGVAYDLERPITVNGKTYQMDCFIPTLRACIEADGPSHGLRGKKDKARDNALARIGIITLRLTTRELEHKNPDVPRRIVQGWLAEAEDDVAERRMKMRRRDALLP